MIGHLCTANLAIIPYLVTLGVQHLVYKGVFYYEKHGWPTSIHRKSAAMASYISLQMSLTAVLLIAVQRAVVITAFPIKFKSVCSKIIFHTVGVILWSIWSLAAILPILTNDIDELKMSVRSNVCLYQDLRLAGPWRYVFAGVFLGVNIVFHVIIAVCSSITYRCVARSKHILKSQQNHKI